MHEPYVSSYVCEECGPTFNADGSPESAAQHHDRHHAALEHGKPTELASTLLDNPPRELLPSARAKAAQIREAKKKSAAHERLVVGGKPPLSEKRSASKPPSVPGDAPSAEGQDTSDLPLAAWRALSFLLKYGQSHMVRWMVPRADWGDKMSERDARTALFWVRDTISSALGLYESHETLEGKEQRVWRHKCCGERVDISKPPTLCSKCITRAFHESAEELGLKLLDMDDGGVE